MGSRRLSAVTDSDPAALVCLRVRPRGGTEKPRVPRRSRGPRRYTGAQKVQKAQKAQRAQQAQGAQKVQKAQKAQRVHKVQSAQEVQSDQRYPIIWIHSGMLRHKRRQASCLQRIQLP